jgi:hypothetical protein
MGRLMETATGVVPTRSGYSMAQIYQFVGGSAADLAIS